MDPLQPNDKVVKESYVEPMQPTPKRPPNEFTTPIRTPLINQGQRVHHENREWTINWNFVRDLDHRILEQRAEEKRIRKIGKEKLKEYKQEFKNGDSK